MTSSTDNSSSSLHKKQQQQTIYVTGEFSNDYCSFTNITFPHKIHSSSAGSFHSGIVTESGDLYMMGINTEGQVGLKDVNDLLTFTRIENLKNVKNIYCGGEFTFILVENLQNSLQQSENGNLELFACGSNIYGQLGNDENNCNVKEFTKINIVDLNYNEIKKFSCGQGFTFILTKNGNLYSTGSNNTGQLGLGNFMDRKQFTKLNNLPVGSYNFIDIQSGFYHSLLLTSDGDVFGCGGNENGQLGLQNKYKSNVFIKIENINCKIIQTACCATHSLLLNENYEILVSGGNIIGQLGINDKNVKKITEFTKINNLPPIKSIYSGKGFFSVILTIYNELFVTGENHIGQLALPSGQSNIALFTKTKQFSDRFIYLFLGNVFINCINCNEKLVGLENEIHYANLESKSIMKMKRNLLNYCFVDRLLCDIEIYCCNA